MSIYDDIESGDVGDVFGASNVLGSASMLPPLSLTGGAGGAAGDSTTKGGNVDGNAFDNSGWNVTFGSNSAIESSRSQATPLSNISDTMKYALIGGVFILAFKWLKKN